MPEPSFLEPQKVLKELELRDNMIAADFGCGAGGWVIPLAKILEEGKVYALDVQKEMLSALEGHASLENILNIETIVCDLEELEGSEIIDNSMDLVLMTNLLFQVKNREQVLKEAKRVLKKGGQVLIVDWKKDSLLGSKEGRISSEEVKRMVEPLGFKLEKEFEAGAHHYGLVFTKS